MRLAEQRGDIAARGALTELRTKLEASNYDFAALSEDEAHRLWEHSAYRPTIADLSGDRDVIKTQTRLMDGGATTSRPLANQREASQQALREGYTSFSPVIADAPGKAELSRDIADAIAQRTHRELDGITAQTQAQVQQVHDQADLAVQHMRTRTRGVKASAAARTARAEDDVEQMRQALPEDTTVDQLSLGRDLRENVLTPERDARLTAAEDQYASIAPPGVMVPPTQLRSAASSGLRGAKSGALSSEEAGTISTARELLRNTQTVRKGVDGRRRIRQKNLSAEEALRTLAQLRSRVRRIDKGELTNTDSAVVRRAIGGLNDDMDAVFPASYQAAKSAADIEYRQMMDELERSLIGRITRSKAGRHVINDEYVFKNLFYPGDRTEAATFAQIIGKPEYGATRTALRDAVADQYHRKMGDAARHSPAFRRKHDTFMRDYGAWMDGIFTPAEMADLRNVKGAAARFSRIRAREQSVGQRVDEIMSGFERRTRSEAKRQEHRAEALGRSQEDQVSSRARSLVGSIDRGGVVNPDAVFDRIWGVKEGMSRLRPLSEALRDSPALWEQFQARAHRDLGDRIFKASQGPDAGHLNNFVRDNGDYLRESFGAQYVDDLRIVGQALQRTTRHITSAESHDPNMRLARDFSRVFFAPPLSARGRAQTAVERFLGANQKEAMAELIADPTNLHRLVTMKGLSGQPRAEYISEIMAQGAAAYYGLGHGELPDG